MWQTYLVRDFACMYVPGKTVVYTISMTLMQLLAIHVLKARQVLSVGLYKVRVGADTTCMYLAG